MLQNLRLDHLDCDYCDVRVEDVRQTSILYQDGELRSCDVKPSLGCFIRVFRGGRGFFAATTAVDQIEQKIAELIDQARGYAGALGSVVLGQAEHPVQAERFLYSGGSAADVPVSDKLKLCDAYLRDFPRSPAVSEWRVGYQDIYKLKHFKSSRGASYSFDYNRHGVRVWFTLREGDSVFQDFIDFYGDRLEMLEGKQDQVRAAVDEAKRFLGVEVIQPGKHRVVLSGFVVGAFAHESFGHKSEADLMLGDEKALREWKIGARIGSDVLSIVDESRDAVAGYCPFDDEGIPAQKVYLIKNGVLSGRLHSLATAGTFREPARGNGRAMTFEHDPIVRMRSTFVEPGTMSFEDLLRDVKEGIYVKDLLHGSGMSTFTIAPRKCYRIRDGRIAEPVRVSVISGNVFETLNEVEACANDFSLFSSVFGGCGKGEQWPLPVSFGGPSIRVRQMQVG